MKYPLKQFSIKGCYNNLDFKIQHIMGYLYSSFSKNIVHDITVYLILVGRIVKSKGYRIEWIELIDFGNT